MLLTESFLHLFLLGFELQFIIEEVLGVCYVLHGPVVVFRVLILVDCLIILDLLCAGGIDFINLGWLESLEVIRNVTVLAELRSCGHWVFSHEISHISSCNFVLIHIFLVIFPLLFSLFLLLCKHLVICLEFL